MNKNWIIGIIIFILLFFALGKYVQYSENQKIYKEISDKNERQSKIISGLYSSKLFGIQLQQQADILLFSIQNLASSYGNKNEVYQDNGLLKNTENLFFYDYSIKLNPFINDDGMENTKQSCVNMYKKLERKNPEELCIKPIIKNDYFTEYFIKYHPYGYGIWSIIGKSYNTFENKEQCVQNLKPYANILMKKIRNENPSDRIVIEDKFYPSESIPIIRFLYKSESNNQKVTILSIEGNCINKNSSSISLYAPLLQPNIDELKNIRKQIIEKKQLNQKEDFDNNVKEKEKSIDTKGLQ